MKLSRKFKHSININKMNDHLPPKIIEHNWNHNIHCILYWFSKEDSILSVFYIGFPKEDSILSVFCIGFLRKIPYYQYFVLVFQGRFHIISILYWFSKEDSILSVFCIDFPKEDSILSVFCQTGMFLLTLT